MPQVSLKITVVAPAPPVGTHYVVAPLSIAPGETKTAEVKLDDGTGKLSPLPAGGFLVPFWDGDPLGFSAMANAGVVTVIAPARAVVGTVLNLAIDIRGVA